MLPKSNECGTKNIMRHSFASYWLATHKNAPELAEIMGNTVPIIRKHYENTVLETVACGFWNIRSHDLSKFVCDVDSEAGN